MNRQSNLEEEEMEVVCVIYPDFNYSNQTVRYWHKKVHIDQWTRIEGLEINHTFMVS